MIEVGTCTHCQNAECQADRARLGLKQDRNVEIINGEAWLHMCAHWVAPTEGLIFDAKIFAGDNQTLLECRSFGSYTEAESWLRGEISRRGWNVFTYIYESGVRVRCL